ncbi:MAG: TolC family protein [Candidatus Atribacteria bacterium]|nr:TolC family protein [Candidatus Atribacteria bacterium]
MGRKVVLAGLIAVLFLVLGFSAFLGAQERLSLEEALEIALRESPTVKKAEAEVEIARSTLRLAANDTLSPEIGVSQSIALTKEFASGFSFTMKDSYSWGDSAEEKKARLSVESAERALREAREAVKQSVVSVYLNILKGEQSMRLAEKNLELLRKKYEKVKAQFEEGNAAAFAVREAEKNLRDGELSLSNLRENLLVLKKKLNGILGRSPETEFAVEPLPEVNFPAVSLEELKALSIENRAEMADLKGQKEAVEVDRESLREEKKPSVKLVGEYEAEEWSLSLSVDPFKKNLDWEVARSLAGTGSSLLTSSSGGESFGVGIVINWTLSSGGVWKEKEKQYELKLAQIEESYRAQADSIVTEVEEKYYQFEKTRSDLDIRRTTIEVEREKYVLRKKQYEMGAIDEETLLGNEIAMMQAEGDYEGNVYDLILTWVDLQRSAGKEIEIGELLAVEPKEVVE